MGRTGSGPGPRPKEESHRTGPKRRRGRGAAEPGGALPCASRKMCPVLRCTASRTSRRRGTGGTGGWGFHLRLRSAIQQMQPRQLPPCCQQLARWSRSVAALEPRWSPLCKRAGAALEPHRRHYGAVLEPCRSRAGATRASVLEPRRSRSCRSRAGAVLESCWSRAGDCRFVLGRGAMAGSVMVLDSIATTAILRRVPQSHACATQGRLDGACPVQASPNTGQARSWACGASCLRDIRFRFHDLKQRAESGRFEAGAKCKRFTLDGKDDNAIRERHAFTTAATWISTALQ